MPILSAPHLRIWSLFGDSAARNRPSAPEWPAGSPPRIRGICFDVFTLFDPRSVVSALEQVAPGRGIELWEAWRVRQFEYSWLRVAAAQYADFTTVTDEALCFAARARAVELSAPERERLVAAYSELAPWPDAPEQLRAWKRSGLKLAPLSNYAPRALERLVTQSGFAEVFDDLISTDVERTFKPDPRAYALGPWRLGLHREEIAFCAFGGWDAVGAKWFGYPTFWVNRLAVTAETLGVPPDGTGPTLAEVARFIEARNAAAVVSSG